MLVERTSTICFIDEKFCIGCGKCVTSCPFNAIRIHKIYKSSQEISHRFGPNGFVLNKLPIPRLG